jgi:hypothetical protein
MRRPLLISAGLHAAALIATLVAFPSPKELPSVQTRALPVELVTVSEMTNLKRQAKKIAEKPKPVEKPVEKPKPEPEKPKPVPQPQPKAEPVPSPEPEEKAEPLPEKKAEKKPEPKKEPPKPEKPKPVKTQKPEKKKPKREFDPTQIAALLDKMPDQSSQPDEAVPTEEKADAPVTDNPDAQMTLSEIDAFKVQMQKCWSVPAGAAGAENLIVQIRVFLNPDGSLAQPPELMDKTKMLTGNSYYRTAAESAMRAIRRCQPFKMPADKYNSWREIELNFDPREMLGG